MSDLSEAHEDLEHWMTEEADSLGAPGLQDQHVANAILRRLGATERKLAAKEELYAAELERLTEWIDHQRAAYQEMIASDRRWLEGWHLAQLGEHGHGPKTIDLPSGVLRATSQPPEYVIEDEATFLAWAREYAPGLVRSPPPRRDAPDRAALKALCGPDLKARLKDRRPGEELAPRVNGRPIPAVKVVVQGRRFAATPTPLS